MESTEKRGFLKKVLGTFSGAKETVKNWMGVRKAGKDTDKMLNAGVRRELIKRGTNPNSSSQMTQDEGSGILKQMKAGKFSEVRKQTKREKDLMN